MIIFPNNTFSLVFNLCSINHSAGLSSSNCHVPKFADQMVINSKYLVYIPLIWFLRLCSFCSLFTAYFLYEDLMSVRLSGSKSQFNSYVFFSWQRWLHLWLLYLHYSQKYFFLFKIEKKLLLVHFTGSLIKQHEMIVIRVHVVIHSEKT